MNLDNRTRRGFRAFLRQLELWCLGFFLLDDKKGTHLAWVGCHTVHGLCDFDRVGAWRPVCRRREVTDLTLRTKDAVYPSVCVVVHM
ncbi:hypothetical protein D3C87_1240450 [compost metagenome]